MKSTVEDRAYHEDRAKAELRLAAETSDPSIAMVHRELAALHRRRMIEIVHFGEAQGSPLRWIGARRPQADR